jgi:hypothetical protein
MVWKDEPPFRTIIVVVINIPMFSRVFLKIGMVRRDLRHFHDSPSVIRRTKVTGVVGDRVAT